MSRESCRRLRDVALLRIARLHLGVRCQPISAWTPPQRSSVATYAGARRSRGTWTGYCWRRWSRARSTAYAVIERLRTGSGGRIDLPTGTVYPALHRLERAGLVAANGRRIRAGAGAATSSHRPGAPDCAPPALAGRSSRPRYRHCCRGGRGRSGRSRASDRGLSDRGVRAVGRTASGVHGDPRRAARRTPRGHDMSPRPGSVPGSCHRGRTARVRSTRGAGRVVRRRAGNQSSPPHQLRLPAHRSTRRISMATDAGTRILVATGTAGRTGPPSRWHRWSLSPSRSAQSCCSRAVVHTSGSAGSSGTVCTLR